jgi:hypothetical protein
MLPQIISANWQENTNLNRERLIMFLKRLGQSGQWECSTGMQCPQILEMVDGDYAVVGTLITSEATKAMPPGPGVGPMEGVVKIPRKILIGVKSEIPVD